MQLNATTYMPGATPMHRADARVKIVLVIVYSVALFYLSTWWGMGVATIAAAGAAVAAHVRFGAAARQLVPVWVLLAITFLANACTFDVAAAQAAAASTYTEPYAIPFADMPSIALAGGFGIVPAGCARGAFYVVRIFDLLLASLVLTTTTSPTQLARALRSLLRPLGRVGVPVRDIATVCSIALRFIPVTLDEFHQVKDAQSARGARFSTGTVAVRMRALQTALIPWFVGMYRHASRLAVAMDARCYGMIPETHTTELDPQKLTMRSATMLAVGTCVLVVLAVAG